MIHSQKLVLLSIGTVALCGWAFIGVLQTFDEAGPHNEFFVKVRPTSRVFFSNPYITYFDEPDRELAKRRDSNYDWLPGTLELADYLAYCKARYGVERENAIQTRTECKLVDFDLRP